MDNISIVKDNCYGCSACLNICPKQAITMKYNKEGFLYPCVDEQKCVNCGFCKKACPHLTNSFVNENNPNCYAYLAKNDVRVNSSSGGAFPIIAKYFLENSGYVSGAIWNEDATVSHIVSNKIEDIEKMRNSKYLQSDIGDCYAKIKQLLVADKKVLFVGTPCQVAGLKAFVRFDYENLYCIDIVCHGVPSPKIFKKYLEEEIIKKNKEKWVHTNFRDKIRGWRPKLVITTDTTHKKYSFNACDDDFMNAFLQNLCLRKTCSSCEFQKFPRQGDITIGDFWGIWNYNQFLNDEKGTSLVLENNNKGSFLVEILSKDAKKIKKVPIEYAINGNPCLISSSKSHYARNLFFKLVDKFKLSEIIDICNKDKVDFIIVNFWYTINYGASITAWAMQELVEHFGFSCVHLNKGSFWGDDLFENSFSEKFAEKFLNISKEYEECDLKKFSQAKKGVILGSDQVLRLEYIKEDLHKFLLDWVDINTRKIALAVSFGLYKNEYCNYEDFDKKTAQHLKSSLESFDYLSCRELSGKEIFKDVFGLNSNQILDPVFLVDKENYEKIMQHSSVDNTNKIVSYILDEASNYNKIYEKLSEQQNAEVVNINSDDFLEEDWLKSIRDCKFLITDSFHGVCFALIFNKPFLCIKNEKRGIARFDSLIEMFNIADNFISSFDEIDNNKSFEVDYDKINQILKRKKKSDLKTIKKVLKYKFSNNYKAMLFKIKNKMIFYRKKFLPKVFKK